MLQTASNSQFLEIHSTSTALSQSSPNSTRKRNANPREMARRCGEDVRSSRPIPRRRPRRARTSQPASFHREMETTARGSYRDRTRRSTTRLLKQQTNEYEVTRPTLVRDQRQILEVPALYESIPRWIGP